MNQETKKIELKSCVFKTISAEFVSSLDKILQSIDSMEKYGIEIAFSVKYLHSEVAVYLCFWINRKGKIPGYSIHTQSFNYFNLLPNAAHPLPSHEKERLEQNILNMSIESVRKKIATITETFPLGPYELPKLNINEIYKTNVWRPNGTFGKN